MRIFIVYKNADFTEGRGPMLFHKAFESGPEAVKYVQAQQGIFGSGQKVEMGRYGNYAYANGYIVSEVELHKTAESVKEVEVARSRQAALDKLSNYEKELLGL